MMIWIFSLFSQRLINLLTPVKSISDIKPTANSVTIWEILPVVARPLTVDAPKTSPPVVRSEGIQLLTLLMAK